MASKPEELLEQIKEAIEAARVQALASSALPRVMVAQVKFTEWNSDDQLRQSVFLGLRANKPAKDVVRESG